MIGGYDNVLDDSVLTANIDTALGPSLGALGWGSFNPALHPTDLTGLEDFSSLTHFFCNRCPITNIDVSNNTSLKYLSLDSCWQLSDLDVSDLVLLEGLNVSNLNLNNLNIINNPNIDNNPVSGYSRFTCFNSNINQLNILNSGFDELVTTNLGLSYIKKLVAKNNTFLAGISLSTCLIDTLLIEGNDALIGLSFENCKIKVAEINNNDSLYNFLIYDNLHNPINYQINNSPLLSTLNLSGNQLTSFNSANLSNSFVNIKQLYLSNNNISLINISDFFSLEKLYIDNNFIECLDISLNTNLKKLESNNNLLNQLTTTNGNWMNMQVEALSNNLTCVEVDNIGYASSNWLFDSFTTLSSNCNYASPCVTTSSTNELIINKHLIKTINLFGKETIGSFNEILFYIYDDGTVEKKITID